MQRFIYIGLFIYLLVFGIALAASAHTTSIRAYEVLGLEKPTILPNSSFYFLKNFNRSIQRFFTFDPVKRVELELRISDEKLAELDEIVQETDTTGKDLTNALDNYLEAHAKLALRLDALKGKNKNVDTLLDKLADRVAKHTELFLNLKDEFDEKDLEKVKKEIIKEAKKASELDEKKFKEKLKEKILDEDLDDLELEDMDFDIDIDDKNDDNINLNDRNDDKDKTEHSTAPSKEVTCTTEFNPICGADGKTYSNACQAKVAGVAVKNEGECKIPESVLAPPPATEAPKPVVVNVAIVNFAFDAKEIKIPVGATVIWTNKDSSGHTATSDNGKFDSGMLSQGASFKFTFTEKGTFPYHCSPHPGMQGKVIVE